MPFHWYSTCFHRQYLILYYHKYMRLFESLVLIYNHTKVTIVGLLSLALVCGNVLFSFVPDQFVYKCHVYSYLPVVRIVK